MIVAPFVANTEHEEDPAAGCMELRSRTLEEPAAPWMARSTYDRLTEHGVKWVDVKASIVVKQVAALGAERFVLPYPPI